MYYWVFRLLWYVIAVSVFGLFGLALGLWSGVAIRSLIPHVVKICNIRGITNVRHF